MKIEASLDDLDIKILLELEKGGTKVSTTDISKNLDIPGRTIRYHMNKLRESGILKAPKIQTYERKLGLGERIILLQSIPERENELFEILNKINIFYHFSTTYGRYDGYLVYTMFPLVNPRITNQIADELKEKGLIKDYFIFDAIDYRNKGAEVKPTLPDYEWKWSDWIRDVEEIMKKGCKFDLRLDEFPQAVRFDLSDIKILKHMVESNGATLKEISKGLNLSLTQVHKRIKRLEETGVIKGALPVFCPHKKESVISCFFKSRDNAEKILCGFFRLPFQVNFAMESSTKYHVQVVLPQSELNSFLSNIDIFRKQSEDFFIQVIVKETSKGYTHLLEFYNEKTESWEIPLNEIIQTIRNSKK